MFAFAFVLPEKRNFIYSQSSTIQQNNKESKGKYTFIHIYAHNPSVIPHEDKSGVNSSNTVICLSHNTLLPLQFDAGVFSSSFCI